MITYRRNLESDIPDVLRFITESDFTERTASSWLGENMAAVVGRQGSKIIGAIPFSRRDLKIQKNLSWEVGHLSAVAVASEVQNKGIGSAMMNALKKEFSSELNALVVNCEPEGGPAYRWYQRNGFTPVVRARCMYLNTETYALPNARSGYSISSVDSGFPDKSSDIELETVFSECWSETGGFQNRNGRFWSNRFQYHYYRENNNTYLLRILSSEQEITGYLIFSVSRCSDRECKADILEIAWKNSIDTPRGLITALVRYTRDHAIPSIRCVCSDEVDLYKRLKQMDFKEQEHFNFMVCTDRIEILSSRIPWTFFSYDYI